MFVQAQLGHRTSHRANPPGQSRRPSGYCEDQLSTALPAAVRCTRSCWRPQHPTAWFITRYQKYYLH